MSGNDSKEVLYEKERHDKALEKYQRDYAAYEEKRKKLIEAAMPLHPVTLQIRMRL